MSRPHCIVCGKAIKKATRAIYLRSEEQAARRIGGDDWLTVPVLPTTKEEAQRLTNHQLLRVDGYLDNTISCMTVWDGHSYMDAYFCSLKCTAQQGRASAQHGQRYDWRTK